MSCTQHKTQILQRGLLTMTFHPDASSERRVAELARPAEDSQLMSVQVACMMDQYSSIKDSGKKCTVDLPDFKIDDEKAQKEKQIILVKEKKESSENPPDKVLLKNPPDKNDGYMLAEPLHKIDAEQNAHNKKVFTEVDTNHNGRLSLQELRHALSDPNSDLTKLDRVQLQSQENQILKHFAITGLSEHSHSHKFDPTLSDYLKQNQHTF